MCLSSSLYQQVSMAMAQTQGTVTTISAQKLLVSIPYSKFLSIFYNNLGFFLFCLDSLFFSGSLYFKAKELAFIFWLAIL